MYSPLSGDEGQIKALLAGSAEEVAAGLTWVDQLYRYKFCGLVRRRFPSLPSEDLRDVWQDTLMSLYRMTTRGAFDRDGPLEGLLWTLAVRRGRDRLRRNASWLQPIETAAQQLKDPRLTEKWQALNVMQRREVVELICESVSRLPPRQKLVWRVYVAHYPSSERLQDLTEEVRKAADGQPSACDPDDPESPLSRKAVSSAFYAGREKIREDLKRKGYDL